MKAISVAAGLALAIAGTACSEQVPAEPENVTAAPPSDTAQAQDTASTGGSRFNLRMPGGEPAPTPDSTGGFNLRGPGAPSPTSGPSGMQLPAPAQQPDPLGSVPDVRAPALNNPAAAIAAGSNSPAPEEEDEDDVIRLD